MVETEGAYQRFVENYEVGAHHVHFSVGDSKGNSTSLSYNLDKGIWVCTCLAYTYGTPCGHIEVAKQFCAEQGALKFISEGDLDGKTAKPSTG